MESNPQQGEKSVLTKDQEEEYIKKVKKNPMFLKEIETQIEAICVAAVSKMGKALKYVKHQTPEICMAAVKRSGKAIQYVKNQTEELCLEAMKKSPMSLEFVENQTDDICLEAIKKDSVAFKHVKNKNHKICLEAIKKDRRILRELKKTSNKLCLELVKYDSEYVFEFEMKEVTDEVYLTAILSKPIIFDWLGGVVPKAISEELRIIWESFLDEREPESYRFYRYLKTTEDVRFNESPYHVLEQLYYH